jgi:hypothetical protein
MRIQTLLIILILVAVVILLWLDLTAPQGGPITR